MNKTLGVLFFLRKNREDRNNNVPIYCRITVDGQRAEFAIQRSIKINNWNSNAGYPKGTKEESRELTTYIDTIKAKINEYHRKLLETNQLITAVSIKNALLKLGTKKKTIVELFNFHNAKMKDLVGQQYAAGTMCRYNSALKHIKNFIKHQYSTDDLYLSQINYEFISGFEHYLRTERKCHHNSTMKYITNLKKVIRIGIASDWIEKDPFLNFKISLEPLNRTHLTSEELNTIEQKNIPIQRLKEIRDAFIFSCYTGLPYIDIKNLSYNEIVNGIDGEKWIHATRTKTNTKYQLPLLPQALKLIEIYKDHPECKRTGLCFPIKSNQKTNAYLKEIATLCGIDKNLTYHTARHTFATTVTLTNDVPIETVSYMLGHTKISTTQIYSKVVEKKISENMKTLKLKLSQINTANKATNS